MRLTRVHVAAAMAVGATVALPEAAAAHLLRVLRLQPGDSCVLFNGDGHDYDARIVEIGKRAAAAEVVCARKLANESPLHITLLQALARGEKMDWILQKATELGVAAFVPVTSDRSEVKLEGERSIKRVSHWQGVVVAACEQSGRGTVPPVAMPVSLVQALDGLPMDALRLLLNPDAPHGLEQISITDHRTVVLAIGPEGGWSPHDRALLQTAGFAAIRLGPRVLRTETAGIAAVAVLQSLHGDLD